MSQLRTATVPDRATDKGGVLRTVHGLETAEL